MIGRAAIAGLAAACTLTSGIAAPARADQRGIAPTRTDGRTAADPTVAVTTLLVPQQFTGKPGALTFLAARFDGAAAADDCDGR